MARDQKNIVHFQNKRKQNRSMQKEKSESMSCLLGSGSRGSGLVNQGVKGKTSGRAVNKQSEVVRGSAAADDNE